MPVCLFRAHPIATRLKQTTVTSKRVGSHWDSNGLLDKMFMPFCFIAWIANDLSNSELRQNR